MNVTIFNLSGAWQVGSEVVSVRELCYGLVGRDLLLLLLLLFGINFLCFFVW